MSTSTVNNDTSTDPYAAINGTKGSSSGPAASAATGSSDTFLKLLVTQMQNQDPLNPMDNAQITSQMAQISTVNGINTLNTTVQGLNTQFVQMQALQGASLVGHDVTLKGNGLAVAGNTGIGGYNLAGAADSVKLEVLDSTGRVVDTQQLGAQNAGDNAFQWTPPEGTTVADGANYSFRITAKSGAASVDTTPLMLDRVLSVSTDGSTLSLELARSGSVAYSAIQAFN
jgi:flagellar basal-body rod modification protein FlgD